MKKEERGGRVKVREDEDEIVAVERFRVEVQYAVQRLMMDQGLTQAALGERLGMSQPRISQMFSPQCNMTIRNLARIFHALGDRGYVWSDGLARLAGEGKVPVPGFAKARYRVDAPADAGTIWKRFEGSVTPRCRIERRDGDAEAALKMRADGWPESDRPEPTSSASPLQCETNAA